MSVVTTILPIRPVDATLSVTKAARLLGVHPNTIRSWSDAGRLRYYRINPRGDRRYRLGDLQRFLAAAETAPDAGLGGGSAFGGQPRRSGGIHERGPDGASGAGGPHPPPHPAHPAALPAL